VSTTTVPLDLSRLARMSGIITEFEGADGQPHQAGVDTIRALLEALGTPVDGERDVRAALDMRLAEARERVIPPIVVHRVGAPTPVEVNLPVRCDTHKTRLILELENGQTRYHAMAELLQAGHTESQQYIGLPPSWHPIEPGYHALTIDGPGVSARARYLVAPLCPTPSRAWGAFVPLHACRDANDWGIGSYPGLAELAQWTSALGAGFVGGLPLYPIDDRPPIDPSPYLPMSRLAYNELYIDPTVVPEVAHSPEASALLASSELARQVAGLHATTLVDYDEISRLKRTVLEPLSRAVAGNARRVTELQAFAADHPELLAYARFRAERAGSDTADYHLYVQWVAATQLDEAATAGAPLYGDFPIGVRSDGFDTAWAPEAFAHGVEGGAPPDAFFSGGQSWGFQPLHPEHMRRDGYRYLVACLRRACRHASFLRIDHVPGLHRLFWIPEGMDARHGAYVRYHSDELRALVCLEAHRSDTVIIGEDLGTVPPEVRSGMADDRMLRSWVMQFETSAAEPLPDPPEDALASWSTHDLPRFASFADGADLESPADADARTERLDWRHALQTRLKTPLGTSDALLRGCLSHLAEGPASLVMIDLEELWGARESQNRPGTGPEVSNWRRRAPQPFETMRSDDDRSAFLASLERPHPDEARELDQQAAAS
jgi:4-alpha-glucanotransferase